MSSRCLSIKEKEKIDRSIERDSRASARTAKQSFFNIILSVLLTMIVYLTLISRLDRSPIKLMHFIPINRISDVKAWRSFHRKSIILFHSLTRKLVRSSASFLYLFGFFKYDHGDIDSTLLHNIEKVQRGKAELNREFLFASIDMPKHSNGRSIDPI